MEEEFDDDGEFQNITLLKKEYSFDTEISCTELIDNYKIYVTISVNNQNIIITMCNYLPHLLEIPLNQ